MNAEDIATQVASWIRSTYPTGIAWLGRVGGTITVDWVDDSSTEITVEDAS